MGSGLHCVRRVRILQWIDPMPAPVKDDIQKELDELDKRITALKVAYDQYFLGMEKLEPAKERGDVNKVILDLGGRFIRNTGAKFRRDQLKSKFLTYARLWDRTLKEIEEGTYRGHRVKAELREKERARRRGEGAEASPVAPEQAAPNGGAPAPAAAASAVAAPSGNGATRPPAPPASAPPKADPIQRIFDQYVAAKKKANETTDGLTPDKMAAIIRQQTAALKQKYNCKSVEFRVVVEDGKAKLKAIPK